MARSFLLLVSLSVLAGCRSTGAPPEGPTFGDLTRWMTGTFRSAAQAEANPEYFDVRLVMAPIWSERSDGPWLYVEQAIGSALERPYRQRVYHLVDEGTQVRSEVYALPGEPLDFAGAFSDPDAFAGLTPEDLEWRRGCDILLQRSGSAFAGSTVENACESSLRGASFATSEVVVEPDRLTSWDRGFDAQGEQVWGAEAGAYVFDRIAPAD